MNKSVFLMIIFFSAHLIVKGKDYYVNGSVTQSGNGTESAAFKTIQEAALMMKAGDICYINEGTYPETIIPSNSGTSTSPIIFQPWHKGDKVLITGLNYINAQDWIASGETFYKANISLDLDDENQVFKDKEMLNLASWPNQGQDLLVRALSKMTKGTNPELIVDSLLPDYDFTNASVWVHSPKYWSNWTTDVISFTKGQLKIKNNDPFPGPRSHDAKAEAEYYIFGILDALDAENEWFFDKKKNELFVLREKNSAPPSNISYKKRMNAFVLDNRSYITIRNLEITGASITTNKESTYILLDGLRIFYPYHSSQANNIYGNQTDMGILLKGRNCTIQNSEIAYSSGSGIVLDGEYNKVINSYIHDTDYIGTYASCVQLKGKGNIISHSTLTRSGRSVIDYGGMYQSLIQYNDMSHSGMLTSDLGITYGNVIEGGNSEIRYNWLHDNDDDHQGVGLYFDHGTQNIISHHNVIWGIDKIGLLINHYGYFHLIYNNTFTSKTDGFRSNWGNQYTPDLYGCRIMNNIFTGPAVTTANNYIWSNNLMSFTGLQDNKYLKTNSNAIENGIFIKGITTSNNGLAPDIGAYEYNGKKWLTGHDFSKLPLIDTVHSNPIHRNMIVNSAFEHEDHLAPWVVEQGKISLQKGSKNQGTPDTASTRMGSWSIKLQQKSKISQTISGLIPNSWYEFSGFLRVEKDGNGYLYASDYGSIEQQSVTIRSNKSNWNKAVLRFRTGPKNTSVKIAVRNDSELEKEVFIDDFGLILIE